MRKFAEFAITTGCRITFQGMNRSANVADDFGVRRVLLQQQAFLVEGLQEFLRALEEEVAKFVCPFVGEKVHVKCSLNPVRRYFQALIRCPVVLVNHLELVREPKQALCVSHEEIPL